MDAVLLEGVKLYIRTISSVTEKEQIDQYIDRQELLGHFLRRPVSATLRNGIHELRPGNHRLLFFFDNGRIFICHGFRKQTKRVPAREIEKAISVRNRYLREGVK